MVEKISLDNPREVKEWDAFVEAHPEGTPFHHSTWLRVLSETYAFDVSAKVLRDREARICGIFPAVEIRHWLRGSRIISLPFSDYCGPLFADRSAEVDSVKRLIGVNDSRDVSFEVRSCLPGYLDFYRTTLFLRHVVPLSTNPSDVYKKTNRSTIRYSIKKAIRNGIIVADRTYPEGVNAYYRLHLQTRRKHRVPCQPKRLFVNMLKHMRPNGRMKILLAEYKSEPIAGGVFLTLGDTVYYKFNGSNPAALEESLTPNHLLTWHAIEQACLDGVRFFDFGRTSVKNKGLLRYKEAWGAHPVALPYSYFPEVNGVTAWADKSLGVRVLTDIWQRLPAPIGQPLGSRFYRFFA